MARYTKEQVGEVLQNLNIRAFMADVIFHEPVKKTNDKGVENWSVDIEIMAPDKVVADNGQEVVVEGVIMRNCYVGLVDDKDWGSQAVVAGLERAGFDFAKFSDNESGAPLVETDEPEAVKGLTAKMLVRLEKQYAQDRDKDGKYVRAKDQNGEEVVTGASFKPAAFNPFGAITGPAAVKMDLPA